MTDLLMLDGLSQFHLLRPWWLLALLPLWLLNKRLNQPQQQLASWRQHLSPQMLTALTISGQQQQRWQPRKLVMPLGAVLIVALAGPSWFRSPSPLLSDQAVLAIALNVSTSMERSDLSPNRLLRAKQKINTLLAKRGSANTALVAYAGSAHVVMPVTDDRQLVRHFLDALRSDIMPVSGADAAAVLPQVEPLFAASGHGGTLLLITDSVDATALAPYRDYFGNSNHQLLLWQIGSADRRDGLSATELQANRNLVQLAGGRLIPISTDNNDVEQLLRAINNHMNTVANSNQPWYDAGYLLLWLLLPAALLWFRRGWSLSWQ